MTDETSTAHYSAFIPEIWSQKLNTMLTKNCVMLQCVSKNYEGEIKNQGDTVRIITPAEVSISTVTDTAISYSELNPTEQDLVIDQKKFFAFKIGDIAQAQANQSIMEAHLQNAKKAIEEVQDSYLLAQHSLGGSCSKPLLQAKKRLLPWATDTVYEQFVEH